MGWSPVVDSLIEGSEFCFVGARQSWESLDHYLGKVTLIDKQLVPTK